MKYFAHFLRGLVLVFFIVSYALSEEPKESFYSQLSRAVIRLEHFEAVKQEGSATTIIKNLPDGTAFFVIADKQLFIVSARHVVEQPYDLHARVQVKNNKTGERKVLLLKLPKDKWLFHSTGADKETNYVDVAVMKILSMRDWGIVGFAYESKESPDNNKNQLPFVDPEPPSAILVFGFPSSVGFELMEQNPLGRLGIVSMKAGKKFIKLESGKYAEERSCLIDVRIFGGNSGSPVMTIGDSEPKLLGLVTATNYSLDFAIMEPTSRIREAIDQAKDKESQGRWEEIKQQ